jgi:hypothetical protein
MFQIQGQRRTSCDGVSRRNFLTIGALGLGGLTLADMLRAAERPGGDSGKSVIHVHLDGGPPQMDTIDPKPEGPAEVRGEFAPIATSVPGIRICELLPRIAARADWRSYVIRLDPAASL